WRRVVAPVMSGFCGAAAPAASGAERLGPGSVVVGVAKLGDRMRESGLWAVVAAAAAGLAAGAAVTRGLHQRARRPGPPADLSPEAFEAREPNRGRAAAG